MTIARTVLCLSVAAGLLAACSKPSNTATSASSAAPTSGPDVTITEDQLPHLKPGEWETKIITNGGQPEVSRHCETGETIKPKEMAKECTTFTFKRTFLGAIVIDAVCGSHGVSSSMHMTVHGDYNGSIVGDSTVSMTIPNQPPQSFTTHTESHYVGACPAGGGDE